MSTDSPLTPERFVEQYGRYFNSKRIECIQNLDFLFVEGSAEGPYFYDSTGKQYLDMWCMGGTFSLGHRNPAVVSAAEAAMADEDFGSLFFFSEAKGELARRLADCTPGRLETTHPVVTGGEAIDLAIKVARGATKRTEILYADQAYHGCTGFALSMMAPGDMRDYAEPLVPDFTEVRYGDAEDIAAKISERTAAVVLEPVRTDADMAIPPAGYFSEVRRLCDEHGAKLVIDEVVCGMGRLGNLWGCEYWDVEPDMLVTAKGFSGGVYPMSALVTRPECLDFFGESPFRQISSFAWSNLGARVSTAALDETQRLLPGLATLGDQIEERLLALQKAHPTVLLDVRRAGMMFAMELPNVEIGLQFFDELFLRGVLIVPSSQRFDVMKLYPPLILESEQVDTFADRMEASLAALA
ncbi:MAG: aspartate aminotransferase family protein [Acidimicrobiia bacterium]|nr:aspartate aminotransferase family protein [Acidimicrobiia bacterium]